MQHATERVERPGESQEALDGKKTAAEGSAIAFCEREYESGGN